MFPFYLAVFIVPTSKPLLKEIELGSLENSPIPCISAALKLVPYMLKCSYLHVHTWLVLTMQPEYKLLG